MPTSTSSTEAVTRRTPRRSSVKGAEASLGATPLVYHPGKGAIKTFTDSVSRASPLTLVELSA